MKYNCHTHIFNIKCVPENFLGKGIIRAMSRSNISFYLVFYLKKISNLLVFSWLRRKKFFKDERDFTPRKKFIEWLSRSRFTNWLSKILNWLSDVEFDFLEKYANFVEAGRERSQELIFDALRKNPVYNSFTRFVVLTLDMDYMGCGQPFCNYETQLTQVIHLKKKYPYHLLPFVSVDPRRGDENFLESLVKRHIEKLGFIGIKIYPAVGFYPFDPKLKKVYAYAEEHAIPIMTHCTPGGVFYKGSLTAAQIKPLCLNPFPRKKYDFTSERDDKNKYFKNNFSDPENYKEVLDVFPGLKICIAHYGGSSEILKYKEKKTKDNWYQIIRKLLAGHINSKGVLCPNIYTDISYTLFEQKVFKELKTDINDPAISNKILFGTDFYMTQQEKHEELLVKDFFNFLNDVEAENKIAGKNIEEFLASDFFKP